jgi:hypothetical protein
MRRTRNGLFQYHEDATSSDETNFRELSEDEAERVMNRAMQVNELLDRYLPGQSERGISPQVLDAVFIHWSGDRRPDRPAGQHVASVLGSTFAYYLRETKQMQWRIATAKDAEPTLAVTHPLHELTVYPIASAEKRVESGGAGFFEPIAAVVEDKLRDAQH